MKEKIKEWIFIGFVFLASVICILTLDSYNWSYGYFPFDESKENMLKINVLQEGLNSLETSECTLAIQELINYYNDTIYDNEVKMVDFYHDMKYLQWKNYFVPIDKCVEDEKMNEYYKEKSHNSFTTFEVTMIEKVKYMYMLKIDVPNHTYIDSDNAAYLSYRTTYLEIIEDLINIQKQESGELDV